MKVRMKGDTLQIITESKAEENGTYKVLIGGEKLTGYNILSAEYIQKFPVDIIKD